MARSGDGDKAVKDTLREALSDQPVGSQASGQNAGTIGGPNEGRGQTEPHTGSSGQREVDGWSATKTGSDSYKFEKEHTSVE